MVDNINTGRHGMGLKKPYTLRLSEKLREVAERCAEHENRNLTNLIETAVRDYCRARGFLPDDDAG
jgi:hypothetical protein